MEKYKTLFPDDKDYDWDKFKENKHLLKKQKREKKQKSDKENDIDTDKDMINNLDENDEMTTSIFKEFYPKEKTDLKKLKALKKESNLKVKEQKYREIFPDDVECDWSKFKLAKKEKKEKEALLESQLVESWDSNFKNLFLDGNNMMYDDRSGGFRNLDFKKLEKDIASLAEDFGVKKNLKTLTIFFDFTKNVYSKESDGLKLNVLSARPDFKTSDDALVDMVGRMSASDLLSSVFVTLDRGLKNRLREKGVTLIMKPSKWFKLAKDNENEKLIQELTPKEKSDEHNSHSESCSDDSDHHD